ANQVNVIATTSSPKLRPTFDTGSGEGVTAALTAVLPPCAAKAITPPTTADISCSAGDSCAVALYASKAATGIRMKVWRAFHTRSNAGTLSAKNSTAKSATLAPITHQLVNRCSVGGSSTSPPCASRPSVASVAYTLRPAAKLVATSSPTSS